MASTLREIGEHGLIERIRRRVRRTSSVVVGIGDDAAVVRPPRGRQLLVASDMLVEDVHFQRRRLAARWIGWKALACNLSDIAAMGGTPLWAVVSLGLPPRTSVSWVEALYRGLEQCARRFGVAIVGGDTVRSSRLIVDVAIVGAARPERVVRRSGAQVGDLLLVTGRLGGSLRDGRHARVVPRVAEAQALLRRVRIHAMMDLSDGLASDLWQLSRASRVVLRVEEARIPVAPAARGCRQRGCRCRRWAGRMPGRVGRDRPAVYHALMDGEDFELLFAVDARAASRVPPRIGACPVTRIGRVVGHGVKVEFETRDGSIVTLRHEGFRHF
ncbi:MAG: thiamine-phosphate kinase [Candidatus Omnitrophota bacterium]|nr:thiamine-phosphate kinase [Candidatus Omnitrophota bacterium]